MAWANQGHQGGMRVSQLIPGSRWAVARGRSVGWAEFSIFRSDKPRSVTLARSWAGEGGHRG